MKEGYVVGVIVKATLFLVLSISGSLSYGALITHQTYSTDTVTELDWLHLPQTAGLSWAYIDTQFGVGGDFEGWRYATGDELDTMLTGAGGTPTSGSTYTGWSNANNGLIAVISSELEAPDALLWQAVLADPFTQAGYRFSAKFQDIGPESPTQDYIHTHGNSIESNASGYFYSFLVRPAESLSPVPIPSAILLFGSGLLGLIGIARHKKTI